MSNIETAELLGVEIAHTGKFNGFDISDKVLDDMVENFNNNASTAPVITINHDPKETTKLRKSSKSQNLGIVKSLKKVGSKLYADFTKVDTMMADLIDSGRMLFRSIELNPKHTRADGTQYENVLDGVTFHGGADGSSAITDLSNRFETVYGFKLFENIETEQSGVIVDFSKKLKKEETKMDNVEITKDEYKVFLKAQGDSEKLTIELKAKDDTIVELKSIISDRDNTIVDMKADTDKVMEQAEANEKFKTDSLEADGIKFVDSIIEAKKLLPKFKDIKVAEYVRLADDVDGMVLFKEDLESRGEVVIGKDTIKNQDNKNIEEFKASDINTVAGNMDDPKTHDAQFDNAEEAVQVQMKKQGYFGEDGWQKAAIELGLAVDVTPLGGK